MSGNLKVLGFEKYIVYGLAVWCSKYVEKCQKNDMVVVVRSPCSDIYSHGTAGSVKLELLESDVAVASTGSSSHLGD